MRVSLFACAAMFAGVVAAWEDPTEPGVASLAAADRPWSIAAIQARMEARSVEAREMAREIRAYVLLRELLSAKTPSVLKDDLSRSPGPLPSLALTQALRSERRTAGDTTIVRTLGTEPPSATRQIEKVFSIGKFDGAPEYIFGRISGVVAGPDGSLWVFDQQVPVLRQYDSTGKYIKTVGRGGEGPGEYSPLVGIALPRNGNVLVMDFRANAVNRSGERPANRIHVFDPAGRSTAQWPVPSARAGARARSSPSRGTSPGIVADTAGNIYVETTVALAPPIPPDPRPTTISGVVRLRADGTVRDTLPTPALGVQWSAFEVASNVPFLTLEFWSLSNHGYMVAARSDRYQIHLLHGRNRITRIERDLPRVAIGATERDAIIDRVSAAGRQRDPLWRWEGPEFPRVKPYISNLITDADGRIWVKLHVPGERVPQSELSAVAPGGRGRGSDGAALPPPTVVFREPVNLFEVFAPDGRYLGRVQLPQYNYPPVMKGNTVWMQGADSAGVPVVTKFRINPPLPR